MAFTPTETLTPIPVEETPPPVAEAPAPAPAPVQEAAPRGFTPTETVTPVATEAAAPSPGPAPPADEAPAPAPEPEPGPVEGAVRGVGEAIGGAIAPVLAQAPEPVQNLANIVGQPVGGVVDAVTNVTGELGQGDIPGAVGAGLQAAGAPAMRVAEEAGTRLAEGKPLAPQNEFGDNPGSALAILPALASELIGAPAPIPGVIGGAAPTADDWARENPDLVQEAYAQGGGQAVMDAYIDTISGGAGSVIPPPQLSNPLDAATSDSLIERGLQVAGAVPEFVGGYAESGKQGTLGPFLKSQLAAAAMDPLTFVPAAVGEAVTGGVGRAARAGIGKVPVVGPAVENLQKLTPEAQTTLDIEQRTRAAEIYQASRNQQINDPLSPDVPPPPAGITPNGAVPAEAVPPPPDAPFVSAYAPGTPWRERPVMWDDTGPVMMDEVMARQAAKAPPRNAAPVDPPPARPPVRNMTDAEIARGATPTATPTAPPSREAIGLGESRWIDGKGHTLVESPNTPRARIRPRNLPQVDGMYRRMFDAPPEEFYAPYPAKATERNVPVSDQGLLARYRGAMTQGLYMLDDWPSARVVRQLPDAVVNGGIDWAGVERLAASGSEQVRTTARKALAGKRSLDLSVHRISTAPDPDLEVRKLVTQYHMDQVSGRFEGPQHTKTTYWRDRADAIADAITEAGYRPTPEGLAALRALNLADEARAAFPDISPEMLRRLDEPSPLLSFVTGGTPAPVRLADDVVEDAPPPRTQVAPEITPAPAPITTPEQMAARQKKQSAANAAVSAMPEPMRQRVGSIADPAPSRYATWTDARTAALLDTDATGRFAFKDGWKPKGTVEDVINELIIDAERWADPPRLSTWEGGKRGGDAEGRMTRDWKALDQRFNPEGDLDPASFKGTDRQAMRDALVIRIFKEAQESAIPPGKPKSKLGTINEATLGAIRENMLFNYLNIPRYFMQNLVGNSVNLTTKVGPKAAIGMFTTPRLWGDIFRNQKSGYITEYGAREAKAGMGRLANVPNSHKAYINRNTGKVPRWAKGLSHLWRSDTTTFIANIPDQGGREMAGAVLMDRGYRKLNQKMPGVMMDELRKRKLAIPDAKVRQVHHDFFNAQRTMLDPNTGKPYRTMFGTTRKFEPIWDGHDYRNYMRTHLAEDMLRKPPPDLLDNAVDRVFRTAQTEKRAIHDAVGKGVDDALFSWRDTNADKLLGRMFLFHYWQSRQGGLYVSEALKRPGLISAYGRMMDEMEQQAEELDQPNWMKGFFQFQNSIAGFTMWYSPVDMVSSLTHLCRLAVRRGHLRRQVQRPHDPRQGHGDGPLHDSPRAAVRGAEHRRAGTGRHDAQPHRAGNVRGASHRPAQLRQRQRPTAGVGERGGHRRGRGRQ